MRPLKQKTIGLVGGCSNVATVEYYKMLNTRVNNAKGGWDIAETLISGMNFGNIEAMVRAGDVTGLSAYLETHVDRLVAGGADMILCASNTLHEAMAPIMAKQSVPWLHIADATGAAIKAQGLSKIALFGTAPTMANEYLHRHYATYGIDIVIPTQAEQSDIDQIIFDELTKNVMTEASKSRYLAILDRMVKDDGAQGLIMGCTEIFLLIDQSDRPDVPFFNTAALHCDAAAKAALA